MSIDLRKKTNNNTFTRITERRQSNRVVYAPIYLPKTSK